MNDKQSINTINYTKGLWLGHSWKRGFFRYQKTRVRNQSLVTFIYQLFTKLFFNNYTSYLGPL